MTSTQPKRDNLYTKLREVLGPDNAGTLIQMLPPDRDDLATKADIDRLDARMDQLDGRMEKFEGHLWDFHGALRAQIRIFATITVTAMLGIGSLALAAAALLL
jgi:hypothetical protein